MIFNHSKVVLTSEQMDHMHRPLSKHVILKCINRAVFQEHVRSILYTYGEYSAQVVQDAYGCNHLCAKHVKYHDDIVEIAVGSTFMIQFHILVEEALAGGTPDYTSVSTREEKAKLMSLPVYRFRRSVNKILSKFVKRVKPLKDCSKTKLADLTFIYGKLMFRNCGLLATNMLCEVSEEVKKEISVPAVNPLPAPVPPTLFQTVVSKSYFLTHVSAVVGVAACCYARISENRSVSNVVAYVSLMSVVVFASIFSVTKHENYKSICTGHKQID